MKKEPEASPQLGTFTEPVEIKVTTGGVPYVWKGPATFAPVGRESIRAISGTGSFLPLVGPTPPEPTPIPPIPVPVPPDPTPIPPTPPTNLINVKAYGVKGDGSTNDVAALNALISKATPAATLFFPAGVYVLGDALKVLRPYLGFLGEGDSSQLKLTGNSYHFQIGSGQPFTGFSFKKLQLYGTPGRYMQDGTAHGGVLNFGSKGTVFEDCLFTGCAEPVMNAGQAGTTYGTVVRNCRIFGWGRVAIFCNGGERVSGCKIIQDDPNLLGERSSHAFYLHGGASDIEIADTEIANARKYALQIYSEQVGTTTKNIRLLRLNVHDCANGFILAHSQPGAGDIVDCLIEGCKLTGVYAGSSIAIKNGDGVMVRGNVIDGNSGANNGHSGAGIYLGVWAPYEPGFSLKNVLIIGNTIHRCDRGIWALPSNGGTFEGCSIRENIVSGNRQDYDITGSGIVFSKGPPGVTKDFIPQGTQVDTRPSDDRSEPAKGTK